MKATIFFILLTFLAHSRGQYHYQGLMNYLENRMLAMEVREFWFIWPRFNTQSAVLLVFSHFTETFTFLDIHQNNANSKSSLHLFYSTTLENVGNICSTVCSK